MTDFTILVDASDIGRMKAVSILNDLYIRKTSAASIPRNASQVLPSVLPPPNYLSNTDQTNGKALHHGFNPSVGNRLGLDVTTTKSKTANLSKGPSQPTPNHQITKFSENSDRSPKGSFWRFPSRSATTTEELHESKLGNQNRSSDRNISPHKRVPLSNRSSAMTVSSQVPTDEDNPWATELSSSPKATHKAHPKERPSSEAKSHGSLRRPSTNESKLSTEDAYGGFCKGAYKLQVGLTKDGLKLRNASGSFQGEGYYWACGSSKCAFEGRSCKVNKDWAFDDTIHDYHGVRYRWAFLAKSHVKLAKVKDGIYDYRCVFCVFQGQESPVFRKAKVLMQHISQHRGEDFDEAILQKTKCINMRKAADEEDFDINLTPADVEVGPGQAVESQPAYDDLTIWSTKEDTISVTNHWRDLT